MKVLKLVFALMFFSMMSQAQDVEQELLKNKNVTWAAEVKSFICLEPERNRGGDNLFYLKSGKGNISQTDLIKMSPKAKCKSGNIGFGNRFLSYTLNEKLDDGSLIATNKDGKALSKESFESMVAAVDTFVSFDPITFEETIETAQGRVSYEWYEATMILYYDQEKKKMFSLLKSLAPIVDIEKEKDDYKKMKLGAITSFNSFVIPMEQTSPSSSDFNDPNVIWAKSNYVRTIDMDNAKILKGNTGEIFKEVFYENVKNGKSLATFSNEGKCSGEFVTHEDIKDLTGGAIDTFMIYNPETKKETIRIHKEEDMDFEELSKLSIQSTWFWNAQTDKLECSLDALRVYGEVYDIDGKFLFNKALYSVWFDE